MADSNEKKESFFSRVKAEFKKIIWPSRDDVVKQTILIIVVVIILGIIVKLLDTGIQAVLSLIA